MYKLTLCLIAILLITTSCAATRQWTPEEKTKYGMFAGGQVVNYAQMNWIREREGWREINPILPNFDHGWEIAVWKGLTSAGVGIAADYFESHREDILNWSNWITLGLIGHDLYAGVGFRFR